MKIFSLLNKIFSSTWFLAFIPAFLIMVLLPPISSKFTLQIESRDKSCSQDVYVDLNSDSISEVIRTGKGIPYFHILILDNDYRVFDQWNLSDSIDLDMSHVFFGNYDNDRYKEIYIFTHKDDSLFLNINEFFDPHGTKSDRIFITNISMINGLVTSRVMPAGFFDVNGDGKDELYFSIATGFGLEPRRLYYYDIDKSVLKTSQLTGMICQYPKLVDSDGDGKPEIFGLMSASGNYKTKVPFTDQSTWLMVFDEKLNFEFSPVEFPGFTNQLEINAYKNGEFKGYLLSHVTGSADANVLKPRILLFSSDGKKIRERLYSDFGLSVSPSLFLLKNMTSDRIFLMGKDLLELNDELVVINKVKSPFSSGYTCYEADINFDGEEEFLLYSPNEEKLVVLNTSLQKIVESKLKGTTSLFKFSHYHSEDQENKLYVNAGDNGYFLQLKRNNYFFLTYLIYPGIYFLSILFILLIRRINTFQVVQKESLKQRLVTLQLQGIKAQLDPHFTFNTLNAVASLIYLEDRQAAYDYMNKFTQMLRGMLNDAERIYRSVGEEVAFVSTYIDLEKLRFGEKFNYEIKIGEGITQNEQVPKLVLQTFAENAIKHGLMPCADGGILKISVEKEEANVKLTIEDNGIGRAKAAGHSTSTGKGLKITGEFYDILNQINKRPIKHTITDLYNESGDPAGTRVEVWVPVEE